MINDISVVPSFRHFYSIVHFQVTASNLLLSVLNRQTRRRTLCVSVCGITSPCASGPWPDPVASVVRSPCELYCRPAIVVSAFRSPVPSLCPLRGCAFRLENNTLLNERKWSENYYVV